MNTIIFKTGCVSKDNLDPYGCMIIAVGQWGAEGGNESVMQMYWTHCTNVNPLTARLHVKIKCRLEQGIWYRSSCNE